MNNKMYNQTGRRDRLTKEQKEYRIRYGKLPTQKELEQVREYQRSKNRLVSMEIL
jgi:hypothetical protein